MRHVIADFLGSVGVIVAALIIVVTGWEYADPIVSLLIGVLILASSWTILRDTTQILLEGAPPGIDVSEVGREMASVPGVVEVHDLHVWMITSGFPALAAHVLVAEDDDCHLKRLEVAEMLHSRFGIDHATLQMDHTHSAPAPDRAGAQPRPELRLDLDRRFDQSWHRRIACRHEPGILDRTVRVEPPLDRMRGSRPGRSSGARPSIFMRRKFL